MSGLNRCGWVSADPIYIAYHDEEWGVPIHNDTKHFEFLTLEPAQAGLSWLTILKRREGYRRVFHHFDAKRVSKMTVKEIELALKDPGIIRNRLKVNSAVLNAGVFLEIQKQYGSFDKYIWGFVGYKPVDNRPKSLSDIPATSELSDKVSKDLKARGMKFVGSTIIYAHLQATGIINDHTSECVRASAK